MRRIFVFVTVAALALAMGMGGMGVAVADDAENVTNETAADVEATDSFEQAIDTETRVTDWSYSSGRFTLEIEADEPTTVSLTEAGTFEEGTSSFNYDEADLEEGTNTITFAVADREGAAVAIATRRSLNQGTGAIVSTGMIEQNPFRHFGGESGLFSGIAMSVGLAALGAAYVVRSEESGVIEA
ncbi:hypothetical protein ACYJ1Y_14315 [Natrialbaceae archaeon A-gly3]